MTEKFQEQNKLAQQILSLSRNTLLVNLRFLDVALSQFQWIPIEDGKLLTDGKHIFYNPRHILACYKTANGPPVREYLHMVFHCVFRHMYTVATLDRDYWNFACDIAVESVISDLGLKMLSTPREQQQARFINSIKKSLKYVTAEKIYAYLREIYPDPEQMIKLRALFYTDDHDIWYMTFEEIAKRFNLSSYDNGNSNGNSDENSNNGGDGTDSTRAMMEKVWEGISQRMQAELETFGKQHGQGINPGAMMQNLMAVNREKYDYTAFLKKFAVMGEMMKINDDEFDYIFYTYGLRLYEKMPLIEPLEYKDVKAIKEFVVAIDTSGSTSGELVQKFVQKTYNILKSTESFFTKINLHIIQCDASIQEDAKITTQEEFDNYLKTMKIRGLGGTDFRPVFEYVDKLRHAGEFTNLKGLIYFTDGDGMYPSKKPDYQSAFVFVEDDYNNPDVPPWAIKLILQKDEI